MQTLRCVRQRHTRPPFPTTTTTPFSSSSAATSSTTTPFLSFLPASPAHNFNTPTSSTLRITSEQLKAASNDIVSSFKAWFTSRKDPFLEQIFQILKTQDDAASDAALRRLNLRLSEPLVLEILNYQKTHPDVLSCLKFFDWAGRQPGFHHTRATFNAIFRILSKARLMSLMLDFLENYLKQRYIHKVRFFNTLVIGYSVAGKPEIALQLFGRMRFQGVDLDPFGYNVLLNALVEEGHFDAVEMVAQQIKFRGFENPITRSIMVKGFCKQRELDRAEEYLRGLVGENEKKGMSGIAVGVLVDALCMNKQFERAGMLVEDFRKAGVVSMEHAYGVWIRNLIKAGKLEGALEFLKDKKLVDGYVPDVFRYNTLVHRLLRENRLEEVFDLLMEMKEQDILPDEVTMNATLCFFCKAGMMDVAVELYDSRAEFGLSVSSMAYNYLINTLVGDVSVDEAYRVLTTAIEQGYFPGKKTFSIIADALCREGKLDKMKDLVLVALDKNFMLNDSTCGKFISALCKARRVEDGYLVHGHLNRLNKVTSEKTYFNLISGFNKASRGDIAARLLIEMQEKGHSPNRNLFRAVIFCLCQMDNPEEQFFRLLEMQLSRHEPSCLVYNYFIDGAGHAKKPELAREVYEMMGRSGIKPNLRSDILLLQSYLKSEKIADTLNFFHGMSAQRKTRKRIWHVMIVGLSKAKKLDYALEIFWEMRANQLKPSLECYEELVKLLCAQRKYSVALNVIEDFILTGRHVSSFMGNVLLLNCLYTRKLFDAWVHSRNMQNVTPSSLMLGKLIGSFSGCIEVNLDIEDMEELIKQCFTPDIYTYNMLLRRLSMSEIDHAREYLDKIREKGYEPNQWTYDTLVHGYSKLGRNSEARKWMDEMYQKGFDLSEATKLLI